jgi:hypothetical protein
MPTNKPQPNPLLTLWNVLGTVGGIISLSSMVQNWFDDLIRWKGFLFDIVASYRAVVEPAIDFLFGWLPFTVPYWLGDYFIFGVLTVTAMFRALGKDGGPRRLEQWAFNRIFYFAFWPLMFVWWLMLFFSKNTHAGYYQTRFFLLWLSTLVLGLVVLLAINSQL